MLILPATQSHRVYGRCCRCLSARAERQVYCLRCAAFAQISKVQVLLETSFASCLLARLKLAYANNYYGKVLGCIVLSVGAECSTVLGKTSYRKQAYAIS